METIPGMQYANWAVIQVDQIGEIVRWNSVANKLFGKLLADGPLSLESLWGNSNESSPASLIVQASSKKKRLSNVWLKTEDHGECNFSVMSHLAEPGPPILFTLQFLEEASDAPATQPPASPPAAQMASSETTLATRDDFRNRSVDASKAHHQKLECALNLTRTVALDFNNALTSILGNASHVLQQMEMNHPMRESLIQIEVSAQRAAEIARDLAAFSEEEKKGPKAASGNLNELLHRCVEVFRTNAGSQIEWKINLESRLYSATFDEAKMQQAIIKVIQNSVEALEGRSGGQIRVMSRNLETQESFKKGHATIAPGCYVYLEISDNGPGIPPDVIDRVFEPFFTTREGHRGLGLAWVYGTVTNNSGSVAISCPPGKGVTTHFYLPAEKTVAKGTHFSPEQLQGNEKILVVDDEEMLLKMCEKILSSYGYNVLTANNGPEALRILETHQYRFDLMITDLVMPSMSGRELMDRIRQQGSRMPIICSTGFRMQHGGSLPEEDILRKPFTSTQLLSKVKEKLAGIS